LFSLSGVCALASQPVAGKLLLMKDQAGQRSSRQVKVSIADPAIALPAPGSAGDPTPSGSAGGGVLLSVYDVSSRETAIFSLPASGWSGSGDPAGSAGYKYKDAKLQNGACKSASLKNGTFRAVCRGSGVGFSLDAPAAPTLSVALRLGSTSTACAEFGPSSVSKYEPAVAGKGQLLARDAVAPLACSLPGVDDVGTLVVLGDSLSTGAAGECAGGACPRYYELLHEDLEARFGHAIDLVHEAVGAGYVSEVLDQVDALPASLTGPVAVVITAGGNNLLNATTDPGFPGSLPALREQMAVEIDDVLDALLLPDRFGGGVAVEVFWADFHDPTDGKASTPGIAGFPITSQYIRDFAAEIDEHVTARGEQLVNLHGHFFGHGLCAATPPPAAGSWLYGDCIHLNATGEQRLAEIFRLEILGTNE
jgi:lysophospholipase L1-like esterase